MGTAAYWNVAGCAPMSLRWRSGRAVNKEVVPCTWSPDSNIGLSVLVIVARDRFVTRQSKVELGKYAVSAI